jgi:GT2 family glycosyltransferase
MTIELSIILVNWNSINYLRPCLASVYQHTKRIKFEVIVIDNASYDGCAEMLHNEFPEVIFIQSEQNLGFSKANNLAFQRASGAAVLFLNPDTLVLNSAIEMMHSNLVLMPQLGAVGCGVLNHDHSLQTHYVQSYPTILNQLFSSESAKRMFPKSRLWGMRSMIEHSEEPVAVEVVMGSCLMVKRSVFEEIGMFDERYFMFAEDVDLCYFIRAGGYLVYYVREGSVIHYGGKSSDKKEESFFSTILQRESMLLFFTKTRGHAYAFLYRTTVGLSALVRLPLIVLIAVFRRNETSRKQLMVASSKWKKLLRWSIGLESVKPLTTTRLTAKTGNQ